MADELEMRISELPIAAEFNSSSLLECAVQDFQSETGFSSKKITIEDLADKIIKDINFYDLPTESSTVLGAISEIKNVPTTNESGNIMWNDNVVATSGRSVRVFKNGKIVMFTAEFSVAEKLTDLTNIITGLPAPVGTFEFTGYNVKKNMPFSFAIQKSANTGRLVRFYGGSSETGDNFRLGCTYICE